MGSVSDDTMSLKSDGNNKLKLLCSYGGKILLRPGDGHLRYCGGETRVVAFNRNITYEEMMSKLEDLCCSNVTFKYQFPTEDLDALVSVTCEEDLQNMKEEYDRFENSCCSRIRVFLFPVKQNPSTENPTLEQRYIDAINGISPLPKSESHCSSPSSTSSDTLYIRNYRHNSSLVLSEVDMNKRSFNAHCSFQAKPVRNPMCGEIESRLRKVRSEGMMVSSLSSPPSPAIGHVVNRGYVDLLQRTHSSPNLEQYPCINFSQGYASKTPFFTSQCNGQPVVVQRTREAGGDLLRNSRLGCSNRRPPQQLLLSPSSDKHYV